MPAWVDSLAKNTDRLCTTSQALDNGPMTQTPFPSPALVQQAPELPSIYQAAHQGLHSDKSLHLERIPDVGSIKQNQSSAKRMHNVL